MQNFKLLVGVVGGTLLLVLAVSYLFTSQENSGPVQANLALVEGGLRHLKTGEVESVSDSPSQTATASSDNENSLVRIVEFSDFQCPACKASTPLLDQLVNQYPGRVELVYRHFPLETIHPNARLAAIASEIASKQNLFWQYHDILFEKQAEWSQESDPSESFMEYASEVGVDVTDYMDLLKDKTYSDLVEADIKDGFALGVQGTPTIYVNGIQVNISQLSAYVANLIE